MLMMVEVQTRLVPSLSLAFKIWHWVSALHLPCLHIINLECHRFPFHAKHRFSCIPDTSSMTQLRECFLISPEWMPKQMFDVIAGKGNLSRIVTNCSDSQCYNCSTAECGHNLCSLSVIPWYLAVFTGRLCEIVRKLVKALRSLKLRGADR